MSTCIICGTPVEGHVCGSHEQDVCFEFDGNQPDDLTPGRFYEGTVDGFADFGVFVNIGDRVTGLLHTSELDRRLESLNWDPGDTVFVQVKSVRDDGNVDLGWSIRQHASEFRGKLIDHPEGDRLSETDPSAETETPSVEPTSEQSAETDQAPTSTVPQRESQSNVTTTMAEETEPVTTESDDTESAAPEETQLERTPIEDLEGLVGDPVSIEGNVVEARQTSGPTIFEIRDETGSIDCAAFESAGVRAYPEIETGDVVRVVGVLEERRSELQIETESIEELTAGERETVVERIQSAIEARAQPESTELLADVEAVNAVRDSLLEAATAIRWAIIESRPVVLRHSATVDGYTAAAAIERAAIPLIQEEHENDDAIYRYVSRRPLDGRIYGMSDAVRDVTNMLESEERHDEAVPLFVFVNAGSTTESEDGLALLETYDADRIVIEGTYPDAEIEAAVDVFVNPYLSETDGAESVNTTALGANVAALVSPTVREEIGHLPAVSYWRDPPQAYLTLAADLGYGTEYVQTIREAIALEAFYQTYDDKRELVADLLFGARDLTERASNQFREQLETELQTASPHLERQDVNGAAVGILDIDAFTHTYEFPPVDVLLEQLRDREGVDAIIGVDEDRLYAGSETPIDMREVGKRVADAVPDGGVDTRCGRDGFLRFLAGERDAIKDAAIDAVSDQIV